MTEEKLGALFSLQDFDPNSKLENMISDTDSRFDGELSDDDMELVAAAGEIKSVLNPVSPIDPDGEPKVLSRFI